MNQFIMIHDLVNPKTGKTIKEENLGVQHGIPVGSLVEVEWHQWFGDGVCQWNKARLWVISHDRDCDGTPLYSISRWDDPTWAKKIGDWHRGFGEESLVVVVLTDAIKEGHDMPEWWKKDD